MYKFKKIRWKLITIFCLVFCVGIGWAEESKDAILFYNSGLESLKSKNIDVAISEFEQALEKNPSLGAAHFSLGLCFLGKGEVPEAIKHFREAIAIDPRDFQALFQLSQILFQSGSSQEALDNLEKALKIKPKDIPSLLLMANIHEKLFEDDLAFNVFHQVRSLDKNSPEAWAGMGRIMLRRGEVSSALPMFAFLVKKFPEDPENFFSLGKIFNKKQKYQDAEENLRLALQLKPNEPKFLIELSRSLFYQDKKPESVKILTHLAKKSTNDPSFCFEIACLFDELVREDEALVFFKKANSLKFQEPSLIPTIAFRYLGMGNALEAARLFQIEVRSLKKNSELPLWQWIAESLVDKDVANLNLSRHYLGTAETWESKISGFILGKFPLSELIRISKGQERNTTELLKNLWFYAGIVAQRQGKFSDARENFENYLSLPGTSLVLDRFVRGELEKIPQGTSE